MLFGNSGSIPGAETMNTSNIVEYQYQLYQEYLGATKDNILNYSQNPELSLKYFKINVPKSTNINDTNGEVAPAFDAYGDVAALDEEETLSGTGITHKFKNYTYDIFEFTPVIEIQPLQYEQAGESWIGTHSSMAIMSIDRPAAGDLFTFYGAQDNTTDGTEIFQITDVSYQRTSHKALPIYNLQFRSAPMKVETIKELTINEVYFYSIHFNKFLKSSCWDSYQYSLKFFQDKISKDFDSLYIPDKSKYVFKTCYDNVTMETSKVIFPMAFNNNIKRLSALIKTGFKSVIDFSTNISLNEFLDGAEHPTITNEDGTPKVFQFCIYQPEELYNLYAALGYTDEDNPVTAPLPSYPATTETTVDEITGEEIITVIPAGPIIWVPIDITDDTKPIAFIDRDFFSKRFTVIDNLGVTQNLINFEKYLSLWEITKKVRNLYYCEAGVDPYDISQENPGTAYDDKSKMGKNKFYNFWDCISTDGVDDSSSETSTETKLFNVSNIYDANGVIEDFRERKLIIGDLGLPLVISFQYGVASY